MPSRMDEMISKGAGAAKSVKARFEGLVGVFRTLAKQHGEVAAMLKRLQGKPEKRAELWPEIRKELLSHEQAEMRELYPVLRQFGETRELAERHDREAQQMEQLIQSLDSVADATLWQTRFDQLVEAVMHHADEEEQEIFPTAQAVMGEETAKVLDQKFLATKAQIANAV